MTYRALDPGSAAGELGGEIVIRHLAAWAIRQQFFT